MNRRWVIAAVASISLNALMIALALAFFGNQLLSRLIDAALTPGDSMAHYLGFRGGGEDILPMLAASAVLYFAAFWICLRIFDYVGHYRAAARR